MAMSYQLLCIIVCVGSNNIFCPSACTEKFWEMPKILHSEFEVFGIVQGVSFRMFTEKQAKSLGVRGWCMNTRDDTVKGVIEALPDQFTQMKTWLEKTGSPTCRIDKAVFSDTKEMEDFSFDSFTIKY